MFDWLFRPKSIRAKLREELYDAQRERLSHELAAEHHRALADMYHSRVDWLQAEDARFQDTGPKS